MGFFKKIKDGLLGTEGNGGSGQQGVITAQELVDQTFEHFKIRLNDSSTDMSLLCHRHQKEMLERGAQTH